MKKTVSSFGDLYARIGGLRLRGSRHSIQKIVRAVTLLLTIVLLMGCTSGQQATPDLVRIIVEADGKQVPVQVNSGTTVQMALQQAGITLGNLDRVTPPSFTILASGDQVQVTRVREEFTLQEEIVPFKSIKVSNESMPVDEKPVLTQPGKNGIRQVTYRRVFEDEQEVSNTIIKDELIVEPLDEIYMVGVQRPFSPINIPGRLAYLAGGNAWVMEGSTGDRRPVVTTGDLDGRVFSLSPKGEWLLFTRTETPANAEAAAAGQPQTAATEDAASRINTLWAVDLTEEGARPVNLKVENVIHFADWVPGRGLTVAYSTVEPRETAPGWQANNDLHLLTFAATGTVAKLEEIIETNAGGLYGWWGTAYAFSPDGARLAYARPDSIGLVDMEEKTTTELLAVTPFQTGSDWAWVPGMAWSPDGRVLYTVTHAPKAGLENQETSPLFDLTAVVMDGPMISVVPQAGMFAYPNTSNPLPGLGTQVAFLQAIFPEQSDSRRYRVAVMDRDGSNRSTIFPPDDFQGMDPDPKGIDWSPEPFENGSLWLAVNYRGDLYLVDSVNGTMEQVTGDGLISRLDWR